MKILAVYDNDGKTIDRYTVVTDVTGFGYTMHEMLGIDDQGGRSFSQWTTGQYNTDGQNRHLGHKIRFEDLDEVTQAHIANRVFGKE